MANALVKTKHKILVSNFIFFCLILVSGCVEVPPAGTMYSPNRDTNTHYPNDFDSCHTIPGTVNVMSCTLHNL